MLPQPAMDPIISRLRPRSVQEILDHAFRLYRRHFLTFVAITAVIFVPVNMAVQLLSVALQGENVELQRAALNDESFADSTDVFNQFFITSIVLLIVLVGLGIIGGLLQYLSLGALTSAIADSYMDRPVSFGGAYRKMLQHVGPLVGAIVLQLLIGIGIFVPVIGLFLLSIGALAAGGDSGLGAGFGLLCSGFLLMLVAFAVYAYVFMRLQVTVPSIMVENLGPVQAIRRSWELVRNYWWRTFALFMVLYLIELVITAGPAGLVTAIAGLTTQSFDPVLVQAISGAITVIVSAFFIPLQLVSWTLYYFDLRVRKEGFDIETAVSHRYTGLGVPAVAGAPGYYPAQQGQYGQYASTGGYPPPALGYSQGYGQGPYEQTRVRIEPEPVPPGVGVAEGAPILPPALGDTPESAQPSPYVAQNIPGPEFAPAWQPAPAEPPLQEQPRAEGLWLSTPSIEEQSAHAPGVLDTGPVGPSAGGGRITGPLDPDDFDASEPERRNQG